MINLSLIELKLIAKIRGIRGYGRMSEDKILSGLNASKSMKTIIEIKKENLSLNELKLFAEFRGIKGYERIFEDKLSSTLNVSKSMKTIIEIKKRKSIIK